MVKSTDATARKSDATSLKPERKEDPTSTPAKLRQEVDDDMRRQPGEARSKQQEAEGTKKLEKPKTAKKGEPDTLDFSVDNIYQSKTTNVKERLERTPEEKPKPEKPDAASSQTATKEKPEAINSQKPERPSDEQIQTTARQLREDLRVDKWAIDPRGGDANKAEQTLSALPRDKETMERLQKSYAEDKDHPNSNLVQDIESRLSKDAANRLKATIENPESNLARLENVTKKLTESQAQKDGQNNLKPLTDAVSVVAPVTGLVAAYNENETEKHLTADRRELRQQLSVMNSKDIEAANQESLTKNGKPIEQMLLETPGLRDEDKTAIQILLKGSDERAKNPELNARLATEAVKAKDVDMLSEALGSSPEARELFQKRGNLELLPQAFSGNELKRAQDLAKHGETQAGTLVEFHQGLFGTDKAGVEQAVKTLSDEQRAALRRGHELANCPTCPADATAADISAMQTYQKFNQTLNYSFNDRDAGDLKARALYGENNLISNLAATHSDGFIGIGAGHDKTKIYDIVDRQLSKDDYDRLKNDKNFRNDLNENLKTYLSQEELDRVNGIIDRKMQAGSYEESKTVGRSTSERLSDLKDGGVSNQDRATAIADILTMSPA
ncbi:MAG: hypothetical protein SFV17_12805, partial [Candidatus Obscuribacter sp.]|nr:hypothetical protein [Candidatus Obscuribacter sp.]